MIKMNFDIIQMNSILFQDILLSSCLKIIILIEMTNITFMLCLVIEVEHFLKLKRHKLSDYL